MRFAVFHLIMALWVLWRFVLPLDLPRRFKAALALLVVVAASFSTVTVFFFGGLLSPEAPRWFLIAGNSGEAVLLFLCGLTAAREVLILFSVLSGRSGESASGARRLRVRPAFRPSCLGASHGALEPGRCGACECTAPQTDSDYRRLR